jgi:hypothetical protein
VIYANAGQIQARPSVPQRLKSYSSFSIDPLLDEKALHGRMLSFVRGKTFISTCICTYAIHEAMSILQLHILGDALFPIYCHVHARNL